MPKNQQAGSFSFSSLGTSNRTVGAALVGAGGSRPGAGGLARLYNWCGRNQPDNIVACVFGGETSLWVLGGSSGSIVGVEPGVEPGAGTTRVPELYTSPDGVTWTAVVNQPFTQGILSGVFYEHGLWFATCQNTNSSTMAVSKDGLRWTPLGNNDPFATFATPGGGVIQPISSAVFVTYAQGQWVACGKKGLLGSYSTLATSRDGYSWTLVPNTQSTLYFTQIAYGNGVWVAVGGNGFASSTDLLNWSTLTPTPGPSRPSLVGGGNSVTFNGIHWVVLYASTLYYTLSPDAGWNELSPKSKGFSNVLFFNGIWFLYGVSGLYTSTDANLDTWDSTRLNKTVYGIAYAQGVFVVCGTGADSLVYSTDGTNWTSVSFDSTPLIRMVSVGFQGGKWIAVGTPNIYSMGSQSQVVASSRDGIAWSISSFPVPTAQLNVVQNSGHGAVTYGMVRGGGGGGP